MSVIAKIKKHVQENQQQIIKFMRDLIAIPGESCQEKEVIARIKLEMEAVGFDEIIIDKMGNIIGRIGAGPQVLAYDAHIDTVGIGSLAEWEHDPYLAKLDKGTIYGRGATDQRGGMVSMVYGAKAIKDLNLYPDKTLYFVGSVQEEDCDGLCWQYILNEVGLKPELVVITEPTNLNIYRGHRGRMEMKVSLQGVSAHASAPERGDNSIYKAARIINEVEALNQRIKDDAFLGKGSIAVTHIVNETASLNAVPNLTEFYLDRRLTKGEDKELALAEIEELFQRTAVTATVSILNYDTPSYTGLVYPTEKYYPTWVLPEDHTVIKQASSAFRDLFQKEPLIDKWTFSTNGVAIMGLAKIPCLGFGPGNEIYAHTVNEQVTVEHLTQAASFYAVLPAYLSQE